jgi:hypothetical protein
MTGPIDYGKMIGLLGNMVMPVADPIWNRKQGILGGLGTEGARSRAAGGGRYRIMGYSPHDGTTRIIPNTVRKQMEYDDLSKAKAQLTKLQKNQERGGRPQEYWERFTIEEIE